MKTEQLYRQVKQPERFKGRGIFRAILIEMDRPGYVPDQVFIEPILYPPQEIQEEIEKLKEKWQVHNRDNGLSWNEVAELINQVVVLLSPSINKEEQK